MLVPVLPVLTASVSVTPLAVVVGALSTVRVVTVHVIPPPALTEFLVVATVPVFPVLTALTVPVSVTPLLAVAMVDLSTVSPRHSPPAPSHWSAPGQ